MTGYLVRNPTQNGDYELKDLDLNMFSTSGISHLVSMKDNSRGNPDTPRKVTIETPFRKAKCVEWVTPKESPYDISPLRFSSSKNIVPDLGPINTQYIPASPSLHSILKPDQNDSTTARRTFDLDLSVLTQGQYHELDFPPFFKAYNYESRIEPTDYEGILEVYMKDEINGTRPAFAKELEYQELLSKMKKRDYFLYYCFGRDNSGFFELKEEREAFHENQWEAYSAPMRFWDYDIELEGNNVKMDMLQDSERQELEDDNSVRKNGDLSEFETFNSVRTLDAFK